MIYNRSTPYQGDKYFRPRPLNALSKWYRTGQECLLHLKNNNIVIFCKTSLEIIIQTHLGQELLTGCFYNKSMHIIRSELAMRSLRPEHLFTSEVVLHTSKCCQVCSVQVEHSICIQIEWSKQNGYILLWPYMQGNLFIKGIFYSCSYNCSWELWNCSHR